MNTKKTIKKNAITFFFVAIFCVIFNYVFSYLGHSVISNSMRFAFLYPLVMGTGVYLILHYFHRYEIVSNNLYNTGIATLMVGSIFQGIIDITGADTTYAKYYFMIGIPLVVIAIVLNIFTKQTLVTKNS